MRKIAFIYMVLFLTTITYVNSASYGGLVLSYTLEKDFYRPGESGEVFLTISNPTSYPLGSMDVEISADGFLNVKEGTFSLDNLPAGAMQQIGIVFEVNSSALPEISYIKVHVKYKDYNDNQKENDLIIPIKILNEPILKVYASKIPELKIGKSEKICFNVINYGGESKDITLALSSEQFSISPPEKFLKSLKGSTEVCFDITPITTNTGNYPLEMTLTYRDALYESTYTDTFTFWVNLSGKVELKVYTESYSEKENAINIVFSNSGNENIKALYVILSSDIEISPNEIYIGDLDRDDYDSEKVFLSPVQGEHVINITAKFRDTFEREYEKTYSVTVMIPEKKSENNTNYFYFLIILIGIFAFIYFKKKVK